MTIKTLSPSLLEDAQMLIDKAGAELENCPELDELFTPEELENAAPFYFVLSKFIGQLKNARKYNGLTQEQVAEKSGLTVESISRLETGAQTNPTWKTLGLYAIAVGCRLVLNAELAE